MTKIVLCILCLIVAVFAILFNNWDSIAYAQNDPNRIFWDENRPLKWSDYQGVPGTYLDNDVGDRLDTAGAHTVSGIEFDYVSQITQNQPCMYTITEFDANAYVNKIKSWVKSEAKSEATSMFLLNHEQTHFDVTEVHARKLNMAVAAEFLGKQFPCPSVGGQSQNDAISEKILQDLVLIRGQFIQEKVQMDLDYDTHTKHGTVPPMQKEWDDYITNLLEYYEPFKDMQETPLTQEEIEANFSQPPLPPVFKEYTSLYLSENGTIHEYASWDEYCKVHFGDHYFYVPEKKSCELNQDEYCKAEYGNDSVYVPEKNVCASAGGGCLIATATFGSELAPEVQFLREIRDNTVLSTASGASFMTTFNSFYYLFSPTVADLERQNPVFKETVKIAITPLLSSLSLLQYVDIDSEAEMLGYGIGIILFNVGMYFVAPVIVIYSIKKII